MNRAVIFAHYDKDSVIDDYVIFYLKELRKSVQKIIFVSCNNLCQEECEKLQNLADIVITETHNEYDFGSYKRGFQALQAECLEKFDEIIFVNDSCYGPLYPVSEIFNTMEESPCDFWGITKNKYGINGKTPHIQSYFIAFRKRVFTSSEFINFINNIKELPSKNRIIEDYEIGLSQMLYSNNFKDSVYIKAYHNTSNITIRKWKKLITTHKMPFLKCSILRLKNTNYTTSDKWEEVVKTTGYPIELIEKNLARTRENNNTEINLPSRVKEFLYDFVNFLPKKLRVPFIVLLRKLFSKFSQK